MEFVPSNLIGSEQPFLAYRYVGQALACSGLSPQPFDSLDHMRLKPAAG